MEVSSHALALHRADAIHFEVALFTNLTQDHLDFHRDMEDYFRSKRKLFEMGPKTTIVNLDDPYGRRLAKSLRRCLTFSIDGADADFTATNLSFDASGSSFSVDSRSSGLRKTFRPDEGTPVGDTVEVRPRCRATSMPRTRLAPWWQRRRWGFRLRRGAEALAEAPRVPGRFEPIDEGQGFAVLVDYAHTPDSLENVLRAARRLTAGRVISVFGAGGDRDRDKRPKMGRAGAGGADLAIVTSDNPRSEEPGAIIEEVVGGIENGAAFEVEPDRRAAIARALGEATAGDTVVIAGKGHEQGQEFEDGRKIAFDDREVAREELRKLVGAG